MAGKSIPGRARGQLERTAVAQIVLEERRDARKFNALLDHARQKLVVKRMGLHGAHFRRALAVANQARIVRAMRPDDTFRLGELADAVEANFNR